MRGFCLFACLNYYRIYTALFTNCSSSEQDSCDIKDFTLTSLLYLFFLLRQLKVVKSTSDFTLKVCMRFLF